MNAAPRLYREDSPPRREKNWRPWCATGFAVLVLLVVGWYVAVEAHNAAAECRKAAEELRQGRREMEEQRRLSEEATKDVLVRLRGLALKGEAADGH